MPAAATLRILWLAIATAPLVVAVVLLSIGREPPMPEHAETAFFVAALASVAGLAVAFALLRHRETRLLEAPSDEAALQTVQSLGLAAMAAAEAPALLAVVLSYLTGERLALAFVLPLVALAALTWPSDARVAHWVAMHRR